MLSRINMCRDRVVMQIRRGGLFLTLQEFYAVVGGNYDEAVSRLMGEAMLRRFLMKFPNDPSYAVLKQAVENENREEAFRAAHTIKGLCLNFSFGTLLASSEALTEALRHEMPDDLAELFSEVSKDYELILDAIANL